MIQMLPLVSHEKSSREIGWNELEISIYAYSFGVIFATRRINTIYFTNWYKTLEASLFRWQFLIRIAMKAYAGWIDLEFYRWSQLAVHKRIFANTYAQPLKNWGFHFGWSNWTKERSWAFRGKKTGSTWRSQIVESLIWFKAEFWCLFMSRKAYLCLDIKDKWNKS